MKGRKGLGEVDVLPCGPEAGGGAGKFCDRGTSFFPGCNLTIRDVGDIIDYLG
jgi:hypothetical protein